MKIERQLGVSIRTQIARKKETQTYSSAFQRRNRCPLSLQLGKCDFCTCFKRRLPAELWRGWRNHVGNKRSRILRKRLSRKTEIDKRALNIAGSPSCNEKIVPIPLTSRPLNGNITIRDSSSIRRRDQVAELINGADQHVETLRLQLWAIRELEGPISGSQREILGNKGTPANFRIPEFFRARKAQMHLERHLRCAQNRAKLREIWIPLLNRFGRCGIRRLPDRCADRCKQYDRHKTGDSVSMREGRHHRLSRLPDSMGRVSSAAGAPACETAWAKCRIELLTPIHVNFRKAPETPTVDSRFLWKSTHRCRLPITRLIFARVSCRLSCANSAPTTNSPVARSLRIVLSRTFRYFSTRSSPISTRSRARGCLIRRPSSASRKSMLQPPRDKSAISQWNSCSPVSNVAPTEAGIRGVARL